VHGKYARRKFRLLIPDREGAGRGGVSSSGRVTRATVGVCSGTPRRLLGALIGLLVPPAGTVEAEPAVRADLGLSRKRAIIRTLTITLLSLEEGPAGSSRPDHGKSVQAAAPPRSACAGRCL
jgi:hypothetical protein